MAPRKQLQIAEREREILRIAGDILHQEGVSGLTMERVLARVDFSKGTLYNHFTCREDLLVAVHAQCFTEHLAYFERGALFRGRARERFLAAGVGHDVKQMLDPKPFRFALNDQILNAASERWREMFLNMHRECMAIFIGIVRDGIASGDLPETEPPEFVAAAAWAACVGADELYENGFVFRGLSHADYLSVQLRIVAKLLDGLSWQPLSLDHDYEAVRLRVLAEVFEPEARELNLLPAEVNIPG